ncbi:MAG: LCP family protein, partial [Herbiconiux sp.]|nr:LCP family protein [Herbiconiux sp.]
MSPAPRLWPQYVGAFLVFVLLAGVASASAALLQVQGITDIAQSVGTEVSTATKNELDDVPPGEPQTLLLIGSDARSAKSADGNLGGQRSDTLMLVRLDPEQGSTAVLSIPRDTRAELPVKGGGYRIGKINEAFSDGGERYSIRAVRRLLDVPVHHVIVVKFGAFQRAVNRLGCLYEDIDRTYFNDNSSGADNYATIDVKSGYQLLCGADTLDWVRFRHLDNDFVRGARQQEFLRSAKSQVSASQIAKDRDKLTRIFLTYSKTDITSPQAIIGLLKLALNSANQPVRNVKFRGETSLDPANTFVTISPTDKATMRREFTQLKAATGASADTTETEQVRKKATKKAVKKRGLAKGLFDVKSEVSKPEFTNAVFELAGGDLPLYYPSVRLA